MDTTPLSAAVKRAAKVHAEETFGRRQFKILKRLLTPLSDDETTQCHSCSTESATFLQDYSDIAKLTDEESLKKQL
ncbi:hypothetical protein IV203_007585 [Nitzschia inconspicua]|uniref:Uncharacterized protein n=1 Tax=Nitzschia inconspicua TaxID=303405 RepID=A0A9K3PCD2_9STRA|nr:hypothetical protein IV203_007585 [Nitzschia inconspicua]